MESMATNNQNNTDVDGGRDEVKKYPLVFFQEDGDEGATGGEGSEGAAGGEGAAGSQGAEGAEGATGGEGEGEAGAEGKKKDGEGEVTGAPENYETFNIPEGFELDEERLGRFTTLAKGLNLPQEGAQQLIDAATEYQQDILKQQQEHWWENVVPEWEKEIKSDKDFGGDKFVETLEGGKRVLAKYGTPELKTFLKNTGYGSNPEVIKMLAKIDRATREDNLVDGQPTGTKEGKSAAQTLYPDQN